MTDLATGPSTATRVLVTPSAKRRRDPRRSAGAPGWTSRVVVNLVLLLFCLYTLMPLTWLVIAATKSTSDLYGSPGFTFADFSLIDNLVDLFTWDDGVYLRWMGNTVLYAGCGAIFSVVVSFLAGYAFDKFEFPGKERWFGFVLVGVLVPAAVTTMPLYLLASGIGLVNTFWGVFLPQIASAFGVYLARIFSQASVPNELLEAARIDGAGEVRTFLTIAVPMMRTGIVTLFLMAFSGSWNNFFLPLVMLNDADLFPVALGIYSWDARTADDPAYATLVVVGALIAIIPVIVLFLSLQRFWKAGFSAGALK